MYNLAQETWNRMEIQRNIEIVTTHKCGGQCLGPLSFHKAAIGTSLCMSQKGRRVERDRKTFKNGLTFSSRPISIQEKIRLRVERCDQHWHGALRLGFTNRDPSSGGPNFPPALAIPDLTSTSGYWASPVSFRLAMPGAEICFWVTRKGVLVFEGPNGEKKQLLKGVDVKYPLWAMIDVYGQTRSVLLLGSEKKDRFYMSTQRSCPAPPPPPVTLGDSCMCVDRGHPCSSLQDERLSADPITSTEINSSVEWDSENCAVCFDAKATVVLPCNHRCMCATCGDRVLKEFKSCPLCRHSVG